MATPDEIQELKGEIRTRGVYIEELKTQWKETNDKDDKKDLNDKIFAETGLLTAKQETLNLYLKSQQGMSHHIFPLPIPSILDVILCPILFRHIFVTNSSNFAIISILIKLDQHQRVRSDRHQYQQVRSHS